MTDDESRLEISRRKALGALGTVGAAGAGAGLGTSALFSDEEQFTNNSLVAGELDMKVAWQNHYADGLGAKEQSATEMPGPDGTPDFRLPAGSTATGDIEIDLVDADGDGNPANDFLRATRQTRENGGIFADTTDSLCGADADVPGRALIELADIKPGDFGFAFFRFELCTNPGFVWLTGGLESASENGIIEPEADAGEDGDADSSDPADVELLDAIQVAVGVGTTKDLSAPQPANPLPETTIVEGVPEPAETMSFREFLAGLASGDGVLLEGDVPAEDGGSCFSGGSEGNATQHFVSVAWWVPLGVGNQIQSDEMTFDLGFYTEQCRHNRATESRFSLSTGTVIERSLDEVPEPPSPPNESDPIPEAYPVAEEEFEELKKKAGKGKLQQPPAEEIEEEGSPDVISVGTEFDAWESAELSARPSDANVAVGTEYALLGVNTRAGIYDKTTGTREFEARLDDLFAPVIDSFTRVFDPKTLYDHTADRFVLVAVGKDESKETGSWLVAVLDDTSPFTKARLARIPQLDPSTWVDYPEIGVDEEAIYLTGNIYNFGYPQKFQYSRLAIIDKASLYSDFIPPLSDVSLPPLYDGSSFRYWSFSGLKNPDGSDAVTVHPTLELTSAEHHYLINSRWKKGESLTLWELRNPTSNPSLSKREVSVSPYSLPPDAEQSGTVRTIESIDARLMNAVYEDGSIWTAHSISYDWNDDGDASAVIKWYEIDVRSRFSPVVQTRGWGRPGVNYLFPTITSNGDSTMIVYNESGPDTPIRIKVAGRTADHTGSSLEDAKLLRDGESEYDPLPSGLGGSTRWGDYNGIVVDPETDNYWTFSQYASDTSTDDEFTTHVAEVFFEEIIAINDQQAEDPP